MHGGQENISSYLEGLEDVPQFAAFVQILDDFRELKKEQFSLPSDPDNEYYPLTFFAWYNFEAVTLDRIYRLSEVHVRFPQLLGTLLISCNSF